MKEIDGIHDKTFKQAMTDVRVAKDFFETYLPTKILSAVDLPTLRLSPNSHVDKTLQGFGTDVLYEVKFKSEETAYCYLLCEHQLNAL